MKNSIDTIGNRARDLPACSAVPQPTAPPRAHTVNRTTRKSKWPGLAVQVRRLEKPPATQYGDGYASEAVWTLEDEENLLLLQGIEP